MIISRVQTGASQLAGAKLDFNDAISKLEAEKLILERKLAVTQARVDDAENREKKLILQIDKLNDQCNQAKQDAAVSKKEVELLREQI